MYLFYGIIAALGGFWVLGMIFGSAASRPSSTSNTMGCGCSDEAHDDDHDPCEYGELWEHDNPCEHDNPWERDDGWSDT